MSMLESKGTDLTAGSRLMAYGGATVDDFSLCSSWRWLLILCMNVVLPDPAIPTHTTTTGACAVSAMIDDERVQSGDGDSSLCSLGMHRVVTQ